MYKIKKVLAFILVIVFAIVTTNSASAQTPPPRGDRPQQDNGGGYSIEQATSDRAQLNTLAFAGLGFLTGNLCSDSFLPPGKVADFFGFQYLRDVTQDGMGHSTDFVTNSANNVFSILSDEQKEKMFDLAKNQVSAVNQYAYNRFPLIKAFRRQLDGDIPTGSSGLSKEAVTEYSSDLYELDIEISRQRAELFADIINSLSAEQIAFLDEMVVGGFASWEPLRDQVDKQNISRDEHVLVMTYASEMFGWYAGDVEADTYFAPERQADYFGGFYIKDAPAMGNEGYVIDESITGDAGEGFIATLNNTQQAKVTGLVDTQRDAVEGIVEKRRAISIELRKYLAEGSVSEALLKSLASEYGAFDGEISYYYATSFSEVAKTLTDEQMGKLVEIKNLEGYECEGAYLYSEKIDTPDIIDTDFLFGIGDKPESVISVVSGLESEETGPSFLSKIGLAKPNDDALIATGVKSRSLSPLYPLSIGVILILIIVILAQYLKSRKKPAAPQELLGDTTETIGQEPQQELVSKQPQKIQKEAIILSVLFVILAIIAIVGWRDLYGQKAEQTQPIEQVRNDDGRRPPQEKPVPPQDELGQSQEELLQPVDEDKDEVGTNTQLYEGCLNNTKDDSECKDCCDCLDADADARKTCRDSCATNDFSQNSSFITISTPSKLGPSGDYSICTDGNDERECKNCCDSSSEFLCGDYQYCRKACGE